VTSFAEQSRFLLAHILQAFFWALIGDFMKLISGHGERQFILANLLQVLFIFVGTLTFGVILFSWQALLFSWFFASLFAYSMGIFHHMYFTHRSFFAKRWIGRLGALFGTLTWRGPFAGPVRYAAMHRVHHAYSDTELDPHSPENGYFHSFLGWFWSMPKGFVHIKDYSHLAPNASKDPFLVYLDQNVNLLQFFWGIICFAFGGLLGFLNGEGFDIVSGFRYFFYGVVVKSFVIITMGNAVDVINHRLGYRNYETNDKSTNSFLMFFIHLGGAISWHNNHHAHPRYFSVKQNWWEFDAHLGFLRLLETMSLVSHIKVLDETQKNQQKNYGSSVLVDEEVSHGK
jgi:sn-1 stearoyl-lipid 9-desaturase